MCHNLKFPHCPSALSDSKWSPSTCWLDIPFVKASDRAKKTSSSALFLLVCHTLIKEVFTWLIGALGKLVEVGVRVIFLLNQNSQGFKKESLDICCVLKQDLFPLYFLPVIYLIPKGKWHWVTIVLELEVNWGDCMSCNSHGQYEQKSSLKIIFLLHFALVCI